MDENYEVDIESLMEEWVGLSRCRIFEGADLTHLLTVNIHVNSARNNKKLAIAREPREALLSNNVLIVPRLGSPIPTRFSMNPVFLPWLSITLAAAVDRGRERFSLSIWLASRRPLGPLGFLRGSPEW